MHVCVEYLFVYFVTQCIHALSHPYMGWISFLKSFYEDLFLFCYAVLPTHLRFMRHRSLSGPAKVVGPRENKLPSSQESASGKSVSLIKLRSKQNSKGTSPENFVASGGCFERYTYRVTTL